MTEFERMERLAQQSLAGMRQMAEMAKDANETARRATQLAEDVMQERERLQAEVMELRSALNASLAINAHLLGVTLP